MELPSKPADAITLMAASCFSLSRAAAKRIDNDVLDLLAPEPKLQARKLAARLRTGQIFEQGILAMLHDLVDILNTEIAKGTYIETQYDYSPGNVSNDASWSNERLTPEAKRLSEPLEVLAELYTNLASVHDYLRAEKVMEELRSAA